MSMQTRRRFLAALSLAGTAGLLPDSRCLAAAAEGRLETNSVRLTRIPAICLAPQYVAEELLRAEGLTDIRYVDATTNAGFAEAVSSGRVDFTLNFAPILVSGIDKGEAITILAGIHVGCQEMFGNERVRKITDIAGKSIGLEGFGATDHMLLSIMAAHIGLDPAKDIHWVIAEPDKRIQMFEAGKIDAILLAPPDAQDLRARHIGHVVASSAVDRPWSQYFCCMLSANRDYVRRHPVATKRVVRAILKAADLCASQPARAAQRLVDSAFTPRYDYALQALSDVPYDKWREYDAEDSVRFYALRLRELGFAKSSPQRVIADGTDWRFLNELKHELKT
jgi:NitT/TauT family transport system substrate-binding protein